MEIIQTKILVKIYSSFKGAKEVRALNGLTFDVEKGDFVGIMGASGSGKTTLLNILSGVDKATTGEVIIDGQNIVGLSKDKLALFRRKRIGYIFQDFNLLDSLTLEENISLPLILDHAPPQKIDEKTKELMHFFSIEDLHNKYPYHISGGQKQRVAAARALVNDPAVIFADEPTGNLDSKSSGEFMGLLTKMNKEKESTVLMVTHDPFTASFCKRIIFIKDGQVEIEITSDGDRRNFFDRILEVQSMVGGRGSER